MANYSTNEFKSGLRSLSRSLREPLEFELEFYKNQGLPQQLLTRSLKYSSARYAIEQRFTELRDFGTYANIFDLINI